VCRGPVLRPPRFYLVRKVVSHLVLALTGPFLPLGSSIAHSTLSPLAPRAVPSPSSMPAMSLCFGPRFRSAKRASMVVPLSSVLLFLVISRAAPCLIVPLRNGAMLFIWMIARLSLSNIWECYPPLRPFSRHSLLGSSLPATISGHPLRIRILHNVMQRMLVFAPARV
jgi:hypothetical protein